MKVLGVSAYFHDSAAALIGESGVLAACQEERYSRQKNDPRLPVKAIWDCLALADLDPADLDAVVYYEQPLEKLERIRRFQPALGELGGNLGGAQRGEAAESSFARTVGRWLASGQLDVRRTLAELLGIERARVFAVKHHESHAASAYYLSPFEAAAVITLDGVGELETATISAARDGSIEKLSAVHFPHSLGLFYSAFTAYLGFEVNEGEYKVMGMAPFGQPTLKGQILDLFDLHPDGTFSLDQTHFSFVAGAALPFNESLSAWLGAPRGAESSFDPNADSPDGEASRRYADIAASVQAACEEVILHVAAKAVERTGFRSVCLAGGVALNSSANGRLERELDIELFVQPAAGDAGGALGAALWHWHNVLGGSRVPPQTKAALGSAVDPEAAHEAVRQSGYPYQRFDSEEELFKACAEALAAGQVIGWMQGRAEWGPRALGARSILASPHSAELRDTVNAKIKFRELFRPFAPAVLAREAETFFELPGAVGPAAPENFMLAVHPVKEAMKQRIPAVTHVDGSARVQVVRPEAMPLFHGLIEAFFAETGLPVLLNTSFNRRGEPIVNDPFDALLTFRLTGLDSLAVGPFLVTKA